MAVVKLAVLLSLVASVISVNFDCSIDVGKQCGKTNDDFRGLTWPEDREQLTKACDMRSVLDCQIEYAQTCRDSPFRVFLGYLYEKQTLYKLLCADNEALVKRYLDNIQCLNENFRDLFNTCSPKNSTGLCRKTFEIRRCIVKETYENCGSEAQILSEMLVEPAVIIDDLFCKKAIEK